MVNIKEIRIGLIGAGWMGRTHANSLLNAYRLFGGQYGKPVFEIVSDVSESAASATAEQLGFARWTTDWRDVVNDERIDVVDIAAWNAFHYEVAKAALENGKHVYCEKPLTLSWEQSQELAELAKAKGVINYVGYNNVLNPANAYVKELVTSGSLGEIIRFCGSYDQDCLLDPSVPLTWRHISKYSGTGALGDLCSHLLSISQYIMGDIRRVQGMSKIVIKQRPVAPGASEMGEVENEDLVSVLAEYENGAIGMIGANRVSTGRKNHLHYEIVGTLGSVYYTLESMNEVHVYFHSDFPRDRGYRKVLLGLDHKGYKAFYPEAGFSLGYNDMKILEAHELLSAITQGTPYICDFNFGARIDKTMAAILKSCNENRFVEVNSL